MTGRSVLLVNQVLGWLSGTEIVTADFARGLTRRGWRVSVFAVALGEQAADLGDQVRLVRDIRDAPTPDLIHGHQHPSLATALARFPGVPALQLCHDALSWKDAALLQPTVRVHAAVDLACRERFAKELGLPAADIPLLPNAIDLDRFRPRPPLPDHPKEVLIVAGRADDHVAAVRQACERLGLNCRAVGYGVGAPVVDIEREMATADIVVGAARIATEAMAVGCAVLVCDARGLAGLARSADYDDWQGWNFGHRLLTLPLDAGLIAEALAGYDAADAALVSRRVRAERGLDAALDRLEAVYDAVLAAGPVDPAEASRAMAGYLQSWLPFGFYSERHISQDESLRRRVAEAEARLEGLTAELRRRGFNVTFQEGPPPT